MAPEKTEPESGDEAANASTVSLDNNTSVSSETTEREPYFEPLVHLPEVKVKTNEEDEAELLKMRCKLFRYYNQESPAEWKERGTGDVKILHHAERKTVRLIMRQDKTLKIRANHYITPFMELKPSCNSDRAFVWSSAADFADEEIKQETFAVRFANSDLYHSMCWKIC
ncbi:Ran-specific GTPase-activating protein [Armadillidium vulgare]|nr:Ran-specific GTPase-activating protein [Armadillidium vulgare]